MQKDIFTRKGCFSISGHTIQDHPEIARLILSKVIVVHAEHLYMDNVFEYRAYSNEFEKTYPGQKAWRYDVLVQTQPGFRPIIHFEKELE
jgi:hypothetical protein